MSSSLPPVDPQGGGQFLITEIALNLLGNELYNIHGEREKDISTLIKNNSHKRKHNKNRTNKKIDVLTWLDSIPIETDISETGTISTSTDSTSTSNSNDNNDYQLPSCKISTNNSMFLNLLHENFDKKKFNSFTINENNYKLINNNNQFINITENMQNKISNEKRERLKKIQNSLSILKQQSNENVLNLIESTEKQYKKMKYDTKISENKFLETNINVINLKSLKKDDVLEKFYGQQRSSLVEESKALVEFMRIMKNQDDTKKELFQQIAKDILEVKKHISLSN